MFYVICLLLPINPVEIDNYQLLFTNHYVELRDISSLNYLIHTLILWMLEIVI
jgi:hypothetical protein